MPLIVLNESTHRISQPSYIGHDRKFPISFLKGKTPPAGPGDGKVDVESDSIEYELSFISEIDDLNKCAKTMFMIPVVGEHEFDIKAVDSPILFKIVPINPIPEMCFIRKAIRRA